MAANAAVRPYTVDDMLRVEEIGKVRFAPTGRFLIFERFGPYEEQPDFGRAFVVGGSAAKLYVVDLQQRSEPRPLFAQEPRRSYTLDSLSRDGRRIVYDVLSKEDGFRKGSAEFGATSGRVFAITPEYGRVLETQWTATGEIVTAALAEGETPLTVGLFAETREEVVRDWRAMRDGRRATASAIGSGRHAARNARGERLVLIDPNDGSSADLDAGKFPRLFVSPDGVRIAGLREDRLEPDPGQLLSHGANMGGVRHALLVYGAGGKARVEPCPDCDVLASSIQWAPDGRSLGFAARRDDEPWSRAAFHVYNFATDSAKVIDDGDFKPLQDYSRVFLEMRSVWLGDELAVLLEPDGPVPEGDAAPRADWFLATADGLENLTAAFDGPAPEYAGVGEAALFFIHSGDLWSVDRAGVRRNLSADLDTDLRRWRAPTAYGELPLWNLQPKQHLILEAGDASAALYFYDIDEESLSRVDAPSPSARVVAVSAEPARAAFVDRSDGATQLLVADGDGAMQMVLEINTHLRHVAGATPVRIDHQGPQGDARISWLLTPPGHRSGEPLATVVNVYPGAVGRPRFRRFEPDQAHALNDHILAGSGYAVLYPSLPVDYSRVPRDPLAGLDEEVFAAVDAAIERGYVDPDRLAVQGQSYGGYAAGGLIGMTDRFKAAVTQAGIYDLISFYGTFDIRRRPELEYEGLSLFGVSWAETSQGGMGAPVWDDPERYWRNSPLMHVENISTPIMLVHGDYDLVSITQSEEFFTALSRLNKDSVFVRYGGEGHVLSSPANIRDMWARILAWYERYLGEP